MAFRNRDKDGESCLSLFLWVSDYKSLPRGWRIHTNLSISIVNQSSKKLSVQKSDHFSMLFYFFMILFFYKAVRFYLMWL